MNKEQLEPFCVHLKLQNPNIQSNDKNNWQWANERDECNTFV